MRNLKQFLGEYQESHQNPVNSMIHVFCVPLIFFSTLGLAWAIPVGQWLDLEEPLRSYVNGATVGALPAFIFYARLGLGSAAMMGAWFLASIAGILGLQLAGLPLVWTCAALWALAWVVQFYGHKVEGAKPSFADDLVFLLIGPLFVMNKLYRRLGVGV